MNILFIMYNIFDIRNGVSNKYINFIKSIENNNNNNISFIMTKNENNKDNTFTDFHNTKIYYTKGIKIPFYDKIKIPHINIDLIKIISSNLPKMESWEKVDFDYFKHFSLHLSLMLKSVFKM